MYFAALLAFQITDGINLYECFPLKKDIFGCLRTSVGARAFLVPLLRKNLVNLSPAAPHVLIEDTLSFLTSAILNQVSFDASYHHFLQGHVFCCIKLVWLSLHTLVLPIRLAVLYCWNCLPKYECKPHESAI